MFATREYLKFEWVGASRVPRPSLLRELRCAHQAPPDRWRVPSCGYDLWRGAGACTPACGRADARQAAGGRRSLLAARRHLAV